MQRLLRDIGCIAVLLLSVPLRGGDEVFVPWKVLNPGDEPLSTTLVLYWLPVSREEIRHSDLLFSRELALYSTRCVGMQVIRPDDDPMIAKLEATGKLPACVLAASDGHAVARVGGGRNGLRLSDVERMLHDEFEARQTRADRILDDARHKLEAGDRDAAIGLYRQVAGEDCVLPRKARDAQKALKKLGVGVTARK